MAISYDLLFPEFYFVLRGLTLAFIVWSLKSAGRSVYAIPLWLFFFSESHHLVRHFMLESWKPIFSILGFLAELLVAIIFLFEGFKRKNFDATKFLFFAISSILIARDVMIGIFFQNMEIGGSYFLVSNMMLAFSCIAFISIPKENHNYAIASKLCTIILIHSTIGIFNLLG
jgi:hypothetical protein